MKTPWLCWTMGLMLALRLAGTVSGQYLVIEEDVRILPVPRPIPEPPIRRPIAPPRPAPSALRLSSVRIEANVRDQVAVTTHHLEVSNPGSGRQQATLLFPVPKGAQLDKFTLEIDGKPVAGELLAADKARGIYEDIVRRTLDPALLEYAGKDLFKIRAFPVEPGSSRKLMVRYTQLLTVESGMTRLVVPLLKGGTGVRPPDSLALGVTVETRRPLKTIYSPTHRVDLKRESNRATLGFEQRDTPPSGDFQLYFSAEQDEVGTQLLTYRAPGEKEGYFVLFASPGGGETKEKKKIAPKDVVFVLDTSGSMAGKKMEQARKALQFCVESLNPQDRFEVVRFSTDTEPLFKQLVDASKDNRARATAYLETVQATGSTAIDAALREALALRPAENTRPFLVVFLTDGIPTIGATNEDEILATVGRSKGAGTRIFSFGLGTDVNTHLLDRLAEDTRAFTQYVLPEEDIEGKVSTFFTRIKEPVLANLKIQFPKGVDVSKTYPSPLPDLFHGDQLVMVGRFDGTAAGELVLEGTVEGATRRHLAKVDFGAQSSSAEHEFLPRLWATRRVGYLMDELRLRGESKELKDEVTELARRYGIVTPYTAYLIVEDERARGVVENRRSLPTLEKDRLLSEQSSRMYREFRANKSGDAAVANAQAAVELKQADVASVAQSEGNLKAERGYSLPLATPAPATLPPVTAGRAKGVTPVPGLSVYAKPAPEPAAKRLSEVAQQNRFVAGKNFFQNGEQWVDAEAQKITGQKPVRVQFGTDDYFALLRRNPGSAAWLALGRNMQVVLAGQVYEIYE